MQKYVIKRTLKIVHSRGLYASFLVIAGFSVNCEIREAKKALLSVYLSLTNRRPDPYGSVSGGNIKQRLSPTTSAEL